jgi:hypothetical protein
MKSKFIEGTSEQYSIREDGVIIKHYKYYKTLKKVIYSDLELKQNKNRCRIIVNNKTIAVSSKLLVVKYFNYSVCSKCSSKIFQKKVVSKSRWICNSCLRKNDNRLNLIWCKKNPEKHNKHNLKWIIKNPDKHKDSRSKARKSQVKNISKSYVAGCLSISVDELPKDLYELFKAQLLVKRKLTEKTGLSIQNFNK